MAVATGPAVLNEANCCSPKVDIRCVDNRMDAIQNFRLGFVLMFGVVPALLLSMPAGIGIISGGLLIFSGVPTIGLAAVAVGLFGLIGAYTICLSATGVTDDRQRLGLLAGIVAAGIFSYFEFSLAHVSSRLEPNYWVFAPIIVASCLLLESYLTKTKKDDNT